MDCIFIICAICLGMGAGVFTGLIPGIHINTIAAIALSLSATAAFSSIDPMILVLFIVAMSVTHTFFDIFPTLFLGIPGDEAFAMLPGHKMVKDGRGKEAIYISIMGSWYGLVFSLVIVGILLFILRFYELNITMYIHDNLKEHMFFVLLTFSILLIMTDKVKIWAFMIFFVSGLFGIIALGSPLIPNTPGTAFNVMFPALAGLFGVSGLIQSLFDDKGTIPLQEEFQSENNSDNKYLKKESALGTLGGLIVGLLPGLGSANVATFLLMVQGFFKSKESKDENSKSYLVSVSSLNTSDAIFSILALFLINKSRSGASVAMNNILPFDIKLEDAIIICMVFLITAFIVKGIIFKYSSSIISIFSTIKYKPLTLSVITFVTILVMFTTGIWGLCVLVIATLVGMIAPVVNARRAQAMGFLLIPVMIFFSGVPPHVYSWLHIERINRISEDVSITYIIFALIFSTIISVGAYKILNKRIFSG